MGKNIIPIITNPLGKGWRQPNTENILIDDTHALMSLSDFNKLYEYSSSLPSGMYEGKMWKSYNETKDNWFLKWFTGTDDPKYIDINSRKIIII